MATTSEDVRKFVESIRVGGYRCPYCGNTHYIVLVGDPSKGQGETAAEVQLTPHAMEGWHPFYIATCTLCGHSEFFRKQIVDGWLGRNSG